MIPTNQEVELIKSDVLNDWGEPVAGETVPMKCNLRSQSKTTTNTDGQEVVSEYQIVFIGFVGIDQSDTIRFTEPNGQTKGFEPITVKYMRDLGGSIAFTKVVT